MFFSVVLVFKMTDFFCRMQDAGVDYILYNRLPTLMEPDPAEPLNMPFTFLSASTRMPSLTFPVGYGGEDGVPIALSLTGPRYSEGDLIALAYGYEQQVFVSMYHATDLYPPLPSSENGGNNNDDDDGLSVVLIVLVLVIGCLCVVAGGVVYVYIKPRKGGNTDMDEQLLA